MIAETAGRNSHQASDATRWGMARAAGVTGCDDAVSEAG
jgi:hypothetical protein